MKMLKATIIVAFLMMAFVLSPGTAYAEKSCAERIKDVRERASFASNPVPALDGAIQIAEAALKKGKKKKCRKKMKQAEFILDKKGL